MVPPHNYDDYKITFTYRIALGGTPPRDMRVCAALGSDEPEAEGGCWSLLVAFAVS